MELKYEYTKPDMRLRFNQTDEVFNTLAEALTFFETQVLPLPEVESTLLRNDSVHVSLTAHLVNLNKSIYISTTISLI